MRQLGQVSSSEVGEVFRDLVRGQVRLLDSEVMAAEVSELCRPKHSPAGEHEHFRSGTALGRLQIDGEREEVTRPRVRRRRPAGGSEEVTLERYQAASDPEQLQADLVRALILGVNTCEMSNAKPKSRGIGRTKVSQHWEQAGSRMVEQLPSRDLSGPSLCAKLLDGIRLSKDQVTFVAIGIDASGKKHVLDFAIGSSKKFEAARELLDRIVSRGFKCEHRLPVVLDGSDRSRGAVKDYFHDSVVQRCLIDKERNIRGKLSKRHWGRLSRLFIRLRAVQGYDAAQEIVADLRKFLGPSTSRPIEV